MVLTRRGSYADSTFEWKEKKTDGVTSLSEPLGGFIFVCNNETMLEDLQRQLFGLPPRYQDSVKAIKPGLPLFLYNYSTKCLHGVFEASSDGGYNLEPDAWESNSTYKNGRHGSSPFPAQVRIRVRDRRPPLEERKFRPILCHYDGPKFRLELSHSEAVELLKLFGVSSGGKLEETHDDAGGEWEQVKSKSKGVRSSRLVTPKRPNSMYLSSGRIQVGSENNGFALSSSSSCQNGETHRKDGESTVGLAQRWISDCDSCSGSSTASCNWNFYEEERVRKGFIERGVVVGANDEFVIGGGHTEGSDRSVLRISSSSNLKAEKERGLELEKLSEDSCGLNESSSRESSSAAAGQCNRSFNRNIFVSYSAALKSGMPASSHETQDQGCYFKVKQGESSICRVRSSGNRDLTCSDGNIPAGEQHSSIFEVSSVTMGCQGPVDRSPQESKEQLITKEGEGKKLENVKEQPWGMSIIAPNEAQSVNSVSAVDLSEVVKVAKKESGFMPGKDGLINRSSKCMNAGRKDNLPDTGTMKGVWKGGAGILRRLHDPDPGVCSYVVGNGSIGLNITEDHKGGKQEISAKNSVQQVQLVFDEGALFNQLPSLLGCCSQLYDKKGHAFHNFQPTWSVIESRRQSSHQKYDKCQEDRAHSRKQHLQSEHEHCLPSVFHAQHSTVSQGLFFLHIPASPPSLMQHSHPSILSPALSSLQLGTSSVDSFHGFSYITNGTGQDLGSQSSVQPDGWGEQWPLLLVEPIIASIAGDSTVSLPCLPPVLCTEVMLDSLHAEILEFAWRARPTMEARLHAEAAVDCVCRGVQQLWPGADVEVFGSFATGLCLSHSDVDVAVVDTPPPPHSPEIATLSGSRLLVPLIQTLAASLKKYDWCESLYTIETASMPVVKLRCKPPSTSVDGTDLSLLVSIDITIGGRRKNILEGSYTNLETDAIRSQQWSSRFEIARCIHNGAAAREYVIEKLHQLPALAPLVLLMKSFLHHKGLNDVYSGGLGSFSLTLMLVFFLECMTASCTMVQEWKPADSSITPMVESSSHASSAVDCVSSDDSISNSSLVSSDGLLASSSSLKAGLTPSTSSNNVPNNGLTASSPIIDKSGEILQQRPSMQGEAIMRRGVVIIDGLLKQLDTPAVPNLGALLLRFLHVFGQEIDFSRVRLVLKGKEGDSGGIFWRNQNERPVSLWIEDPLRPGSNVGSGSFAMWRVQAAMQDMLHALSKPQSIAQMSHANERFFQGPGQWRNLPMLDHLFNIQNFHPDQT